MLSFVVVVAAPFLVQEVQVEIVAVILAAAAAAAAGSRAPGAGRVHGAVDVAAASASVLLLLLLLLHVRTLDEAPHWVHGGVVVWRGAHRRAHSTGTGMLLLLLLLWRLLLLLLWHHVWGHAIAHLAHLQKIKAKKRANII